MTNRTSRPAHPASPARPRGLRGLRPRRAGATAAVATALALLVTACGTSAGPAQTAQFHADTKPLPAGVTTVTPTQGATASRSEEHTSEL